MTQFVTRMDESLAAAIDHQLIADGIVASRSDAVRRGLRVLLDQVERQRTAEAIVAGYSRLPQTVEDVAWVDESTERMIADEPW